MFVTCQPLFTANGRLHVWPWLDFFGESRSLPLPTGLRTLHVAMGVAANDARHALCRRCYV